MVAGDVQLTAAEESTPAARSGVLPREMGVFAVFLFVLSGISLAYSGGFPVSTIAGLYPGSDLLLVLAVMLGVALVLALLYAVIGALAPVQGADYVLASRVISPPLAFAFSWTMVIMFSIGAGAIVASIFQTTVPMFLQILMRMIIDHNLSPVAAWLQDPYATVLLGTVGVILLFLMLLLPPKVTRRVLLVGAVLTVLAWGVLCWQISTHQSDDFAAGFDRYQGQMSYLNHLLEARRMGMQADFGPQRAIAAGLLMTFWVLYGFQYATSIAGEVRRPGRSLFFGSVLALLAFFGLSALTIHFLQRAVPLEWMAAESFLALHGNESAMPWLPFYGALLRPVLPLVWIMGAVWIFGVFNMAHVFLYTCSRVIMAWSKDDLFPSLAAFVHPTLRSPLVAVLVVCILAEIGVLDAALGKNMLLRFNPLLFMVNAMVLPILALVVLPFRRPAWFATAPRFARLRIGPLPVISLLGTAALGYLVYMITANSLLRILGGIGEPTLVIFASVFGLGLAWFFLRRAALKEQGKDIHAVFRQLPGTEHASAETE